MPLSFAHQKATASLDVVREQLARSVALLLLSLGANEQIIEVSSNDELDNRHATFRRARVFFRSS
jgi:hypothetical protein